MPTLKEIIQERHQMHAACYCTACKDFTAVLGYILEELEKRLVEVNKEHNVCLHFGELFGKPE